MATSLTWPNQDDSPGSAPGALNESATQALDGILSPGTVQLLPPLQEEVEQAEIMRMHTLMDIMRSDISRLETQVADCRKDNSKTLAEILLRQEELIQSARERTAGPDVSGRPVAPVEALERFVNARIQDESRARAEDSDLVASRLQCSLGAHVGDRQAAKGASELDVTATQSTLASNSEGEDQELRADFAAVKVQLQILQEEVTRGVRHADDLARRLQGMEHNLRHLGQESRGALLTTSASNGLIRSGSRVSVATSAGRLSESPPAGRPSEALLHPNVEGKLDSLVADHLKDGLRKLATEQNTAGVSSAAQRGADDPTESAKLVCEGMLSAMQDLQAKNRGLYQQNLQLVEDILTSSADAPSESSPSVSPRSVRGGLNFHEHEESHSRRGSKSSCVSVESPRLLAARLPHAGTANPATLQHASAAKEAVPLIGPSRGLQGVFGREEYPLRSARQSLGGQLPQGRVSSADGYATVGTPLSMPLSARIAEQLGTRTPSVSPVRVAPLAPDRVLR